MIAPFPDHCLLVPFDTITTKRNYEFKLNTTTLTGSFYFGKCHSRTVVIRSHTCCTCMFREIEHFDIFYVYQQMKMYFFYA